MDKAFGYVNFDDVFGRILGMEWSMGGITNITAYIYLVGYDTPEDRTVGEYEFKMVGRKAIDPVEEGKRLNKLDASFNMPVLYVYRPSSETVPPPEILAILEKAAVWEKASTAHPYLGPSPDMPVSTTE